MFWRQFDGYVEKSQISLHFISRCFVIEPGTLPQHTHTNTHTHTHPCRLVATTSAVFHYRSNLLHLLSAGDTWGVTDT